MAARILLGLSGVFVACLAWIILAGVVAAWPVALTALVAVTGSSWERLHDITEAGAMREGVFRTHAPWWPDYTFAAEGENGYHGAPTAIEAYRLLWDEIANERTPAKGGIPCDFAANPLVWVVQFEVKEVRGGR